ncbi:DUF1648 domain-containing protein [Kroppenstedtia pulmonis]|uniref:DUF1648 domain-containing protein n=1 Tax=Kroppenstedtia pulmonis TaxID=1380685 RepID=A0A7D3XSE5_9BACL|nr:DUF1648 domain-containing protein [Kroppenstedtia pulmonis]
MVEHPRIRVKKTKTESLHDFLCIILFLGLLLYLAFIWPHLPDQISIHYDLQGNANQWGSKWLTLLMILLTFLIFLGFTIVRKYPHKFHYPSRLTKENAERFYQNANRMNSWLKFENIIFFSILSKNFIDSAANTSNFMNDTFFPLLFIWIFSLMVTIIYFLVQRRHIQ